MVALSQTAAGKVKELLEQEGRSDIALRVAVQPGGCSGLRYAMYLDDQIADGDTTAEQFGVRVVVDRMSVPYLSEAKIDFVDSLEASGFTIDNPVAQGSCACGHSFH
ncbi:MAG TPA: iron-sulfur cluster assembly accessory protein [Actinomycetota bacterium]|jgi:iron-sulfur cluster assembly accessory protein